MNELILPSRYEPLKRLGKGGGGEVWSVVDRCTGSLYALKVLAAGASEREMAALVREAMSLSGLEGLGLPRVMRFGRLPSSGRPFLIRELIEGRSLEEVIDAGDEPELALESLAAAAEKLTILHRAGLLHGDVKPANIIVPTQGSATLVDLGLSAPWREGGVLAEGLTPRYAAPELLEGGPLTVRAEVYALGVALVDVLESDAQGAIGSSERAELVRVAERATSVAPDSRHPSVDEYASALRIAAGLPSRTDLARCDAALWPIVGMESAANHLFEVASRMPAGSVLSIRGRVGSGRSVILRRLVWEFGIEGRPVAWLDETASHSAAAVEAEIGPASYGSELIILVDDADSLSPTAVAHIESARAAGARLVVVGGELLFEIDRHFDVPPLERHAARELVRRVVPSLTERLLEKAIDASERLPGQLRRIVTAIAGEAVACEADLDRVLGDAQSLDVPAEPLERARYHLDHGRFNDASIALDVLRPDADPVVVAIARARLELGLGEAASALERLDKVSELVGSRSEIGRRQWTLCRGRALLGVGDLQGAVDELQVVAGADDEPALEALSYRGLGLSLLGQNDEAVECLEQAALEAAQRGWHRIEAVALASAGLALQRTDRTEQAQNAYERAIAAAERANDAGVLATAQLNLAGLLKVRGNIAAAIEHFEAALDMGQRSGRRSTVRQALLNLANTDLYLGRLARARGAIDALVQQREQLPATMRAQLLGLEAEYCARSGDIEQSLRSYEACAAAYEGLGRTVDAAEAKLEGVLAGARSEHPDVGALERGVVTAESLLAGSVAHRPLLLLAQSRFAWLVRDEARARSLVDDALGAARATLQREWVWRALEARAELEEAGGQPMLARRDREDALAVLEEIGARLPRDLREVYWNDPRRRQLKTSVQRALATAATEFVTLEATSGAESTALRNHTMATSRATTISSMTATPLEQRLARILEVNHQLAGVLELEQLTGLITDHAVGLLRAERGHVLLRQGDGSLTIHTSRGANGDEVQTDFSRSIAEAVMASGEPVVSLCARDDLRMKSFESVHQAMLQSVACVPIRAPVGAAIGALYLETRLKPGAHFERELPTLVAFADQVAIAIENARLIRENKHRADELALANKELEEVRDHLRELLGERTAKLKAARQKLRVARDMLYGHFGYRSLVGTSAAMRRVYALIERVKDADVPVLITGESGTGKEVVARAIHEASARSKRKLLGVNCGAIPENLLESELFGHVRGAFTGADRDRRGLFREGEGGSLLLDEIGEMPARMQASLLRVLQERRVRPVGGATEEPVDVRLIFATNRDLAALVQEGRFREDLYYRIHVVEVCLPPLRERREDIPQLVDHFLGIFSARYRRDKKTISREALRRLSAFAWPGNVRQLEHVLLNAWVLSEEDEIDEEELDLPDGGEKNRREPQATVQPARASGRTESSHGAEKAQRRPLSQHRIAERDRIVKALQSCNWNRVKAAELSGIPRRTFYRRLREYGIQ